MQCASFKLHVTANEFAIQIQLIAKHISGLVITIMVNYGMYHKSKSNLTSLKVINES